jgi:hypothetical protein
MDPPDMLFCPFISGVYIYLVRIGEMQSSVFSLGCFLYVLMHNKMNRILLHEYTGLQAKKFGINLQAVVTELLLYKCMNLCEVLCN